MTAQAHSTSSKIIRLPEVKQRTGLSRTTLYTMMAEGRFPKPFKLNLRANGWTEADIDTWIASRIAERGAE